MADVSEFIIDLQGFEKIRDIQDGAFGSVYSAREKSTQKIYAVKILKSWSSTPKEMQSFMREISIMSSKNHPTIIPFRGYTLSDPNTQKPAIVTLFEPGGSLYNLAFDERAGHPKPGWDITQKMINLYGIAVGMEYLHNNHVIHRDLKPGNVLIDENMEPIITDFGLSKVYKEGQQMDQSMFGGTLQWMAPELFEQVPFDQKVDVYAYAMIVYEIMAGQMPFGQDVNQYTLATRVIRGERPTIPDGVVPPQFSKLITDCWAANPADRPTFSDIVNLFRKPGFLPPEVDMNRFNAYDSKVNSTAPPIDQAPTTPADSNEEVFRYGMKCLTGDGVLKNPQVAANYLKRASEQGHPQAMVEYAKMVKSGIGTRKDEAEANILFCEAAKAGNSDGQYQTGLCCFYAKDYPSAYSWFAKSASQNNPGGLFMLGFCLFYGQGVVLNRDLGTAYFLAGAQLDNEESLAKLMELNMTEELKEFALQGHHNAEYYFGLTLMNAGQKGPGAVFLRRAADHGVPLAMCEFGIALIRGDGVVVNPQAGYHYLKLAADREIPKAQLQYGYGMMQSGYRDEAVRYFQKAYAHGIVEARNELVKLGVPC